MHIYILYKQVIKRAMLADIDSWPNYIIMYVLYGKKIEKLFISINKY